MSLLWHIVQKDLRRLWPWLALLFGAMFARYLNFHLFSGDDDERMSRTAFQTAEWIDGLLLGLSLFATSLASATLVHEDPVTGDRAFWLTRPISGARLLAAKSLALLLALVLAPLSLQLGWWCFHRFGFGEIASLLPLMAARQAGTAFAAFGLALLTRNLGSFILTAIISGLATIFAHVTVDEWLRASVRASSESRLCLEIILSFVGICSCIALQYFTRRTARTLIVAAFTLLLCLGIHGGWPWTFYKSPSRLDAMPVLASAPNITFSVGPITSQTQTSRRWINHANQSKATHTPYLSVALTTTGIPAGHALEILDARFPETLTLHPDRNPHVILPHPYYPEPYTTTNELLIFTRGDDPAAVLALPEAAPLSLTLALRRPETTTRLPLAEGATGSRGSQQLRLVVIKNLNGEKKRTLQLPDGSTATTRTTLTAQHFSLIFDAISPTALIGTDGRYAEPESNQNYYIRSDSSGYIGNARARYGFFLISRRDGSVTRATTLYSHSSLDVDGVRKRSLRVDFPIRLWEADLAHYDVLKITAPLVGTFTHTLPLPAAHWVKPADSAPAPQ